MITKENLKEKTIKSYLKHFDLKIKKINKGKCLNCNKDLIEIKGKVFHKDNYAFYDCVKPEKKEVLK